MFLRYTVSILLFVFITQTQASWNSAEKQYSQRKLSTTKVRNISLELIDGKFYFSALPWFKEYLARGTKRLDRKTELALGKLIDEVGLKQFETLPIKFLKRSKSDNIRFIVAKKFLRAKKYDTARAYLDDISINHKIYPFAQNMLATIYSVSKKYSLADIHFKKCITSSNQALNRNVTQNLILNRDYCVLGKARNKFGERQYEQSELLYLDIPKSSYVWPEILFEEAWNSYYQGNYNRTLGKLVSYKAPVLDHMFNPEVKVLEALSYLRLCLYDDAKNISDSFYDKFMTPTRNLRRFLNANRKKTTLYFNLVASYEKTGSARNFLMKKLLKQISKDIVYVELKEKMIAAQKEYENISSRRSTRFKKAVVSNLKEVMRSQRNIIGAYIRGKLISQYANLYKTFEGMSYIKLEVLAQRKARLYEFNERGRSRGDIKYIERNEKQYFWDFNGEFWADELGDYVFALKSEC